MMKSVYGTRETAEDSDEEGVYLLTFTGAKKVNVRLRKKFINLLLSEKYDEITKELSPYTMQQIGTFFIEEGRSLLRHAILASSVRPLDFIFNNIPAEAVKQVFNDKKFDFLEGLLYTQKRAEMRQEINQAKRDLMVQKFVFLLQIEPNGVQAFMNEYALNKDYLTPSIAEDYQAALKCFQEEKNRP